MRNYITSMLCALACSAAVHADDRDKTLYAAAPTERPLWQQTSPGMLPNEYQRTVDHNRDMVQQQLQVVSLRLLTKAGDYGQAVGLLGTAVAVAATDQRVNLNDSKTVGMVFRDTVSGDRTVLLEYRKAW
ncbi:MAG: hypothetical protein WBO37_16715 [Gammaproteobacteria bacterium]